MAAAERSNEERLERKPRRRKAPSVAQLERWFDDGGCEATDGCWVEFDGVCPHGHQSWAMVLGLV